MIYMKDENGLPSKHYHLFVARNVLVADEIKYFISNAPPETPIEKLLQVAFSRWRIERCFEDGKGEVGLDHYEGRKYTGLKRHWIITAVSYLFLARVHATLRKKKSRANGLPSPHGRVGARPVLVA